MSLARGACGCTHTSLPLLALPRVGVELLCRSVNLAPDVLRKQRHCEVEVAMIGAVDHALGDDARASRCD